MREGMISEIKAEEALEFLRKSAKTIGQLWRLAREAEADLENTEGLLVVEYHAKDVPATVAKAYARSDDRWLERKLFAAKAEATLKEAEARREAARIAISLYQSEIKDRM